MTPPVVSRLRAAMRPGTDPYEFVELDTATRSGGALLLGFALAGLTLPLSGTQGPLGWPGRRSLCWDARHSSTPARVDALTGLRNRRALEEALPEAVALARRTSRPLSVLVGDLDDFKAINDTLGHQAGDDVLRKAAQSLTAAVRLSDPCFRWGGDEFVAILPDAGYGEASDVAARARETVSLSCRTPEGRPLRITIGAGKERSQATRAARSAA